MSSRVQAVVSSPGQRTHDLDDVNRYADMAYLARCAYRPMIADRGVWARLYFRNEGRVLVGHE